MILCTRFWYRFCEKGYFAVRKIYINFKAHVTELFARHIHENLVSGPLMDLPTLPIPKRPELNRDRLFWMKMSIMNILYNHIYSAYQGLF